MNDGFIDLRQNHAHLVEDSFWPSFTDIMTVVVMIFLIATSILIVKNWELVDELQARIEVEKKISQRLKATMLAQQKTSEELQASLNKRQEISRQLQLSLEAERRNAEAVKKTSEEKATLEEQLTQAQSELSMMRLQLMQARESEAERDKLILEQSEKLADAKSEKTRLTRTISQRDSDLSRIREQIATAQANLSGLKSKLEVKTIALARTERELKEQLESLSKRDQEVSTLKEKNQAYQDSIENYERQITAVQQQHSILVGEYENLEDKYNKLIKPSRSAIGKYVVEVRYEKLGGKAQIQFRKSDKDQYETISEKEMHQRLKRLKDKYKDTLYVKIIIPDQSGLSYSEAWSFMSGVLNKYDYYYQD
jgi:chromosome segregation ATPase